MSAICTLIFVIISILVVDRKTDMNVALMNRKLKTAAAPQIKENRGAIRKSMKSTESSLEKGDELRKLRRRLNEMEGRISYLLNELDTETMTENANVPDDVSTEQLDGYVNHIKYVSETEREDVSWGIEAENQINTAIGKTSIALEQSDVQCGSTLCKVIVDFDHPESKQLALEQVPFLVPWSGEAIMEVSNDDSQSVVLYAAREGFSLPELDQ